MDLFDDNEHYELPEAAAWMKALAVFLDLLVTTGLMVLTFYPAWQGTLIRLVWALFRYNILYVVLIHFILRFIFLLFITRTPGMIACSIVLRNGDDKRLSIKERVLAAFFVLYKGADYYQK